MNNITVVIPCRAGSTRVINKNFKKFANSSLFKIKLDQAISLNLPVVVNSDSEIAKNITNESNIKFIQRPEYYASSKCNNSEYYEYLGSSVDTELIMILQPTAPLLKLETLKDSLEIFSNNLDKYDSLVTSIFAKKHAWYKNKPINYDVSNTPNSQDLDPIILPTFNVMIAKTKSLIEHKNIITPKCYFYEIEESESIEIDNQLEFDIAEILYERNNK